MKISSFFAFCILCFLFAGISGYGQKQADSLIKASATVTDDIDRCRIYLEISQLYQKTDSSKSALYRDKAVALAALQKDERKLLQTHLAFAKHYLNARLFDEARNYTEKARSLTKQTDKKDLAMIWYYSSCIYLSQGNIKKALDDLIQSYRLADAVGDDDLKAHVNSSFGVIYQQQNQLDSALAYYQKSFSYFKNTNSQYAMVGSQNIGNILLTKSVFTEGQSYLKRALDLARQLGDISAEMIILGNIANGYEREGKLDLAERYATELVKDAEKTGFLLQVMYGKSLLSTVKLNQKKYDEAIRQAEEALKLANQTGAASFIPSLYEMLIAGYEQKGDYRHAYDYKSELTHFKDSLSEIENSNYIEEIKQKYNLQKKNQELLLKTELIREIEKTGKQKTIIIISLLVLVLSGAISVFLFFQRRRIREELSRKDMILENQNKNFEAFIKGQEDERKRIASDLHDGLAQNLVMLKMGLGSLSSPGSEEQGKLEHYSQEIDRMIEETRQISHNMMPGVLVDLGLQKALKSLISDINTHHPGLQVSLNINEGFAALPSDTEIQLYRIIQELLNNTLKHSGATICTVSLNSTPSQLSLEVKDNGKGFETSSERKGIGLQNIRSRANSLRATLEITSIPDQGTSVHIHMKAS